MKPSEFKKIIKEAVKEAIQEELKDILLEAVRSSKQIVKEAYNPPPRTVESPFTQPTMDLRSKYMDVLGETALSFTSNNVQQPFKPHSSDPINGNLGAGEVGMDQIMNLLNSK